MPSVLGHVIASSAIGYGLFLEHTHRRGLLLAALCAVAPDADVLAFAFGIPYESIWGHRGWTHSLAFAVGLGGMVGWLSCRQQQSRWHMAMWLTLATASHPLLDMLTTGGLGCALWWPFSEERLFFGVRVIRVSPLEWREFMSKGGMRVWLSELFWIGLPCIVLVGCSRWMRYRKMGNR
jgi:inner membrane protein